MIYRAYDYQKTATQWIIDKPRCGLFLDMGLGKTVSTLTAIQQLIDDCDIERVLVVAPKKVAETTWSTEADKWEHLRGLRVVKVLGTEKQRCLALAEKADIYVTGRDNFVWLCGKYGGRLPFDALVIDELTSFKSSKSERFKAMRVAAPSVKRIIGLTGTPAPNGLIDLWAQMYCIDQGERLGKSVGKYRDNYFSTHKWNNIVVRCDIKKGCEDIIRSKIADICLSMQAKDYLQLPDMITHTVSVKLSDKTMAAYNKFERDKVLEFKAEHGDEPANVLANSAAGLMNKLSQFANGAIYDDDKQVHAIHNEKLDRLAEIVEAANGNSVLVFYQYKHDITRISERLKGYRVRTYHGEADLRDWNNGEIPVAVIHPASAGHGLNLQSGGSTLVWFGLTWSLELYQQTNARLHRQGQTETVVIHHIIAKDTIDEDVMKALRRKEKTQSDLIDAVKARLRR